MSTFESEIGNGSHYLAMKIGRAYKHIQEFESLYVAHCGRTDPYAVTKQDDAVNERHVVRVEYRLIDGDLALSLSDFVYCLRSGLDQLVWNLSLLTNPTPSRDTMFPIHSDQLPKSEDIFKRKVWDVPCEAVAVIKHLQPYRRGAAFRDDPLWQLNELSNIDKHRLPSGSSQDGNFYLEPLGFTRRELDNGVEFSWPLSQKDAVVFKPAAPVLKFGDPIYAPRKPGDVPVEVGREEITEIYRYVREDVAPRFTRFFESAPNP